MCICRCSIKLLFFHLGWEEGGRSLSQKITVYSSMLSMKKRPAKAGGVVFCFASCSPARGWRSNPPWGNRPQTRQQRLETTWANFWNQEVTLPGTTTPAILARKITALRLHKSLPSTVPGSSLISEIPDPHCSWDVKRAPRVQNCPLEKSRVTLGSFFVKYMCMASPCKPRGRTMLVLYMEPHSVNYGVTFGLWIKKISVTVLFFLLPHKY